MAAILYLRVSTQDQKDYGLGLEAQRHAIEQVAAARGLGVRAIHQDDTSGSTPLAARPGLAAAIAALEPGDILIAHARDRLARHIDVMREITRAVARRKAAILSAEGMDDCERHKPTLESAASRFTMTVMDAQAQMFREQLRARVAAVMSQCVRQGRKAGMIPYGYVQVATDQRTRRGTPVYLLERHAVEQATLRKIMELRAAGWGSTKIANHLNAAGSKTRCGGKWWPNTVASIVRAAMRPERAAAAVAAMCGGEA